MKFFQIKKYSILSKVAKYSFIGVIAIMIILPTLFLKAEAASPTILDFYPTEGKAGDVITISGQNLTGITSILFNTTPAFTKETTPELKVTVPSGATTGPIKVTTPGGTATSISSFKVNQTTATAATTTSTPTNTNPTSSQKGKIKWNGLVPECNSGVIDPITKNYAVACDFDMLMAIINQVISFLLMKLATPLFALIIVYTGWLYLSSMGSSENITKAKKIFKNAIIGYVIALAAWLIVKTILTSLDYSGEMYLSSLLINLV